MMAPAGHVADFPKGLGNWSKILPISLETNPHMMAKNDDVLFNEGGVIVRDFRFVNRIVLSIMITWNPNKTSLKFMDVW